MTTQNTKIDSHILYYNLLTEFIEYLNIEGIYCVDDCYIKQDVDRYIKAFLYESFMNRHVGMLDDF